MATQFITSETLRQLMQSDPSHVAIDVREEWEWDEGHIEGAQHIPLQTIAAESVGSVLESKDTPVTMVCEHGIRATSAAEMLEGLGYTQVKVLKGGYADYAGRE